jgi:glutathione S-transferase
MPELEIIGIPQSTYTRVVRMAANEKGVDYKFTNSPPHSDPVDAIHPFGKVPVMRHGDVELCESKAICDYLDQNFDGPPLNPVDAVAAAKSEQWVSLINTEMDRTLIREYLFAYLFPKGEGEAPDRAFIDTLLPEMRRQLGLIDTAVGGDGYLAGDSHSVADLFVLPILTYLNSPPESGEFMSNSQNLSGYIARNQSRASFQATHPPAQTS